MLETRWVIAWWKGNLPSEFACNTWEFKAVEYTLLTLVVEVELALAAPQLYGSPVECRGCLGLISVGSEVEVLAWGRGVGNTLGKE